MRQLYGVDTAPPYTAKPYPSTRSVYRLKKYRRVLLIKKRMLLETFLANQLKNEHFSNDDATYVSFVLLLIIYAIFTIFIAIRYPVANNILISLLLAILITPVFWILKIIELIAGTTLDRLSNNRRRT